MRRIRRGIVVAIPTLVVILVGMIALAIVLSGTSSYAVPLAMAAGVGILAGLFFGVWAGFVLTAHDLEVLDHETLRRGPADERRGPLP